MLCTSVHYSQHLISHKNRTQHTKKPSNSSMPSSKKNPRNIFPPSFFAPNLSGEWKVKGKKRRSKGGGILNIDNILVIFVASTTISWSYQYCCNFSQLIHEILKSCSDCLSSLCWHYPYYWSHNEYNCGSGGSLSKLIEN